MSETEISERDQKLLDAQNKAAEDNATRSGKGTRLRVGQTRGKNPQVVTWEAFDESLPDTLPSTLTEFMALTGLDKAPDAEKTILSYVTDGYNSAQYTAASDPIAEFVNPAWSEDVQKQFRMAVRNYSNAVGCSIEDAVALIKPGVEKAQAK